MLSRLTLSTALLLTAASAQAQLISVKTVPIAQADQFQVFPSRNIGMGGVSIALGDSLFDLGVNPAKGVRLGATTLFSSPYMYASTGEAGSGRTLPLGGAGRHGSWFGGFSAALQDLDLRRANGPPQVLFDAAGNQVPTENGSSGNQFGFGAAGREVAPGLSIGAALFWAKIHALDGVDRMYGNSQSVRQSGHAEDLRVGALKQWEKQGSLEAVLVHNRFAMTHDVTFLETFFSPALARASTRPRLEHNVDNTNTWGLHLGYVSPVLGEGLRVGAVATANRMSHPKIPEYQIVQVVQTIPWDPGHTNALNFGFGVSKVHGPATLAIDVIYEPIWTHTWGEAQDPTLDRNGNTIPAGGRTVENWFHFNNATIRMGVDRRLFQIAGFQLGLDVHSVKYGFWQADRVQVSGRTQRVSWTEVTPTWGFRFAFPEMEFRYQGRVLTGLGRPGAVSRGGFAVDNLAEASVGDAIVAPPTAGVTTLPDVSLFTHQVSISFPLTWGASR